MPKFKIFLVYPRRWLETESVYAEQLKEDVEWRKEGNRAAIPE